VKGPKGGEVKNSLIDLFDRDVGGTKPRREGKGFRGMTTQLYRSMTTQLYRSRHPFPPAFRTRTLRSLHRFVPDSCRSKRSYRRFWTSHFAVSSRAALFSLAFVRLLLLLGGRRAFIPRNSVVLDDDGAARRRPPNASFGFANSARNFRCARRARTAAEPNPSRAHEAPFLRWPRRPLTLHCACNFAFVLWIPFPCTRAASHGCALDPGVRDRTLTARCA